MSMPAAYHPVRTADERSLPIRGLDYRVNVWGDPAAARETRPVLILLHGWMDLGLSFQFVVDALAALEGPTRCIVAPDWRGFGGTSGGGSDSYWFPDYLGDLDALANALSPAHAFDLLGHSMGGNVAMSYAGVRPARVRRLINVEGFGMPATRPEQAPDRLAQWLDELKTPLRLSHYDDAQGVADRLRRTNPRLTPDKASWLATRWAQADAHGHWHLRADAAHKRVNPALYRADETVAIWRCITAPLLWIEGAHTDMAKWWGHRYPRAEFEARLSAVPHVERVTLDESGHMLHHDEPAALAAALRRFLDAGA